MNTITLTITFEDPFWIGIFERNDGKDYEVAKFTFGSEPKDYEVYEFILKTFHSITFWKSTVEVELTTNKINPKRLQKQIKKTVSEKGIGTKAQIVLKEQFELNKQNKKILRKQRKEEVEKEKFNLRQQKKKEKHRGR